MEQLRVGVGDGSEQPATSGVELEAAQLVSVQLDLCHDPWSGVEGALRARASAQRIAGTVGAVDVGRWPGVVACRLRHPAAAHGIEGGDQCPNADVARE